MGCAEIISLSEVRARTQWDRLREQLHARFALWLERLEEHLPKPESPLVEVTEAVWNLRQDLTGDLSETIIAHAHLGERTRTQAQCPQCDRRLTARSPMMRTVETMGGTVQLERPSFYCRTCRCGVYPLDEVVGLAPGCQQLDVQKAAAKVAIEMPYDEAQTLLNDLTGVGIGSERMHTLTNQAADGLPVLDVAPSREEIKRRIAEVAAGKWRRPVVVLGIDGAYIPTRPESARKRRSRQQGSRAKRTKQASWHGHWRDAKGFRFYLMDDDRIVHLLSWHQVQNEAQLGEALDQVKKAGVIPEDQVRLCVVCDGASWIWKHVKSLFPHARQVLGYYHCMEYLHRVAKAQYDASAQASPDEAEKAIAHCWDSLDEHRERTHYRTLRQGGYP